FARLRLDPPTMFVGSGGAGLMRANRSGRTVMSHAKTADKLLIKPAAGARPAPPRTRGQFIRKAPTRPPGPRRVTRGTATTRLATAPDRPTRRVLPSPEGREVAYDVGSTTLVTTQRCLPILRSRTNPTFS